MWKIWWAPTNASRWQMGFNSAVKGLKEFLPVFLKSTFLSVTLGWLTLLLCIMINIIAVIIIIIIVIVGLGFGGECLHIFHSQVLKNLRYPAPLGPKCCRVLYLFPDITVLHLIMSITLYQSMSQTAGTTYFVPLCPISCCLLHYLLPHHLCLHNIVSLLRYSCDTLSMLWCFDHNERCHQVERISDLTTSS